MSSINTDPLTTALTTRSPTRMIGKHHSHRSESQSHQVPTVHIPPNEIPQSPSMVLSNFFFFNQMLNKNYTGDPGKIKKGAEFSCFDEFDLHFKAWKEQNYHPFRIYNSDKFKLSNGEVHPIYKVRAVSYHCSRYGQPRPRGQSVNLMNGGRPTKHLACGCRAGLRLVYNAASNCLRITTFNDEHNEHEVCEEEYHAIVNKQYKMLFSSELYKKPLKRSCDSHSHTSSSSPYKKFSSSTNKEEEESPPSLVPITELSLSTFNDSQLSSSTDSQNTQNRNSFYPSTSQLHFSSDLHSSSSRKIIPEEHSKSTTKTTINYGHTTTSNSIHTTPPTVPIPPGQLNPSNLFPQYQAQAQLAYLFLLNQWHLAKQKGNSSSANLNTTTSVNNNISYSSSSHLSVSK